MTNYTKRFTKASKATIEKRAASDSDTAKAGNVIRGYAAVFYDASNPDGTQYALCDDMIERLMPGAFDRAISEMHDARGLFNHDPNWLLGRVSSGTVRLSVDSVGLKYEIDINESDPQWQSVSAKVSRKDITGSSFGFIVRKATWTEEQDADGSTMYYRQVEDVDLYDVSPVTWPAYGETTAECDIEECERTILKQEAMLSRAHLDHVRVRAMMATLGL